MRDQLFRAQTKEWNIPNYYHAALAREKRGGQLKTCRLLSVLSVQSLEGALTPDSPSWTLDTSPCQVKGFPWSCQPYEGHAYIRKCRSP